MTASEELRKLKEDYLESVYFTKVAGVLWKAPVKSGINLFRSVASSMEIERFIEETESLIRREGGVVDVETKAVVYPLDMAEEAPKKEPEKAIVKTVDTPKQTEKKTEEVKQEVPAQVQPAVETLVEEKQEEVAMAPIAEGPKVEEAVEAKAEEVKPEKPKRKRATKAEMEERRKQKELEEQAKAEAEKQPVVEQDVNPEMEEGDDNEEKPESIKQETKPKEEEIKLEDESDLPFEGLDEDTTETFLAERLKGVALPLIRRITVNGDRYYYEVKDGRILIHSSATTLISDGYVDRSNALTDWVTEQRLLGKDPSFESKKAADLGTMMHYLYGLYLKGQPIHLRPSYIRDIIHTSDLRIDGYMMDLLLSDEKTVNILIEDMLCLAKFVKDYNVKPLAIEKVLRIENLLKKVSPELYESIKESLKEDDADIELGVASPLDFLCEMEFVEKVRGFHGEIYKTKSGEHNAGDPKETVKEITRKVIAIVDFKSGGFKRSGSFYPEHAFQLELYRIMVEENFKEVFSKEELDGIKLYNFMPKSISKTSAYYLKDQTNNPEVRRKAKVVFAQGIINHAKKSRKVRYFTGVLDSKAEGINLDDFVREADLVKELERIHISQK